MSEIPLALVTGASRGIGAAIASALAPTHRLLLGGRDPEALSRVAGDLPTAEPWPVDVTDFRAVQAAAELIDRLDVLVHSAGVLELGNVQDARPQAWRHNLEVNVVAVAELTRVLLPALRAARGHVVIINSGAGLTALPGWGAYSASKFAARAFADVLRVEERGNGIRVTSVFPGRVDTDMQRSAIAAEGKKYTPEAYLRPSSIAAAVAGAVTASEDAHQTEIVVLSAPR